MATAFPAESIREAARRMADFDVGTLVVLEEPHSGDRASRAVGVVTDRDIVLRCVARELDPDEATVSDVMTTPVHTVRDETPVVDAIAKMAGAGARRLVVVEDGDRVAGVLSLDDVLGQLLDEVLSMRRLLEKQQPRVPA